MAKILTAALIKELQYRQLLHDELFHQDISYLCTADRIKHYVLHLAKYGGKFQDTQEDRDDKTTVLLYVDTFAILMSLGNALKKLYPNPTLLPLLPGITEERFMFEYVVRVGRLAKHTEDLDHVAAMPDNIKELIWGEAKGLWGLLFTQINDLQSELVDAYHVRLVELRSKWFLGTYQLQRYVDTLTSVGIKPTVYDRRTLNRDKHRQQREDDHLY